MKTFLFAWNPKNWAWDNIDDQINEIAQSGVTTEKWGILAHKQISIGDRAFLMRLGEEPKGIIASGIVVSNPFLSDHWKNKGVKTHQVSIEFDTLLNPLKDDILSLDTLEKNNILADYNWTPQASGIEIPPKQALCLESLWADFNIK